MVGSAVGLREDYGGSSTLKKFPWGVSGLICGRSLEVES